jgi:hypothetical protein
MTSGAQPLKTWLASDGSLNNPVASVTSVSAPTTRAIQASGAIACRDQPRADRQCRRISVTTTTASPALTTAPATLTASQAVREPCTSSRLAGQRASHPL